MLERWMEEIPGSGEWTQAREIVAGWSGERKFRVERTDGEALLLRASDGAQWEKIRSTHEAMLPLAGMDIRASRAVACGRAANGAIAWALLTYLEGEPAEPRVRALSAPQQYALGLSAGETLRRIHSVPAPAAQPEWEARFNAKIDRKRERYARAGISMPRDENVFSFIEKSRSLLAGRPQCLQHGDYHIGNMLLSERGLGVIDFNRLDYGDPWEEFNRVVWCAQAAPTFAKGRVDGYFGRKTVPEEFFALMALYIANNVISTLPWAIAFGEGEIRVAKRQYMEVLEWYDDFRAIVPSWYR